MPAASGSAPQPSLVEGKTDYGIDAPGVVLTFLLLGPALIVAGVLMFTLGHGNLWRSLANTGVWSGSFCTAEGLLMLLYAKVGKFRHRDTMLAMHDWRGDEQVLDVGTGRGLLLIGAAKKLTYGHGIGIDIWSSKDLSGNAADNTERNIELEGVAGKLELRSEDARKMSFPDGSFDVVLSNLCLHNIPGSDGRTAACREITRVLKPGGVALISDFQKTSEYARTFRQAGLEVSRSGMFIWTTFPPLRIVKAMKPEASPA